MCRAGSGDNCDPIEFCHEGACPVDQISPSTVVCRPAVGPCDLPEYCPGTPGGACPSDALAASESACPTFGTGVCAVEAQCDGSAALCPLRTIFYDDFDRGTGSLGDDWESESGPELRGDRVCGAGVAHHVETVEETHLRVSFSFLNSASSTWEIGFVADGLETSITGSLVRTDDAYELRGMPGGHSTSPFVLDAAGAYLLQLIVEGGQLRIELLDGGGTLISTLPLGSGVPNRYGFFANAARPCVDNFLIERLCPDAVATPTPSAEATPSPSASSPYTPTPTPDAPSTETPSPPPTTDVSECDTRVVFSDSFNRADGELAGRWMSQDGHPSQTISGQQACGSGTAIAIFDRPFTETLVRMSFTFSTQSAEAFEVYAAAVTDGGAIFQAGCTAGTGGICTPVIVKRADPDPPDVLAAGSDITLTTGQPYGLEVIFDDGTIRLRILDADDAILAQLNHYTGASFTLYGTVLGGAELPPVCIDDLQAEVLCVEGPPSSPTPVVTATEAVEASPTPSPAATATESAAPSPTTGAIDTTTPTPAANATETSPPAPTDTVPPAPTDTVTQAPTETPTSSATFTPSLPTATEEPTPTPTPSPSRTTIALHPPSAFAGSRRISGRSDAECPNDCQTCDGLIHVYHCGAGNPPVCYDEDDVEVATCLKSAGLYACLLDVPLAPGLIVYATDECFGPPLVSAAVAVQRSPAAAPPLSPLAAAFASLLLASLGGLGLRRGGR